MPAADPYVLAFLAGRRVAGLVQAGMSCPRIARFVGNTSPDAIQDVRRGLRKWMRRSRILRIYAITGATVRPQPGPGYLPDVGVGRRLRALLAMGWRPQDLAAAGVDPTLITHTPGWVDQDTHRLVCRAYDELGMQLGPSPEMLARARAADCLTPLAWDDELLDDPDADPDMYGPEDVDVEVDEVVVLRRADGERLQVTPAEAAEVFHLMRRRGYSDAASERHTGLYLHYWLTRIPTAA